MKSNLSFKLKIEKFITEQLWQYLLIITFCCLFGWLFQKWFQVAMFVVSHTVIRPRFDKQYHCKTTFCCLCLTLSILLFATYLVLPLELSLLSTLPLTYLICWVGYLAQMKVDYLAYKKKIETKTIEQMADIEFADYCRSKHLSEEEISYAKLILRDKLKGESLYRAMGYSAKQCYRIKKIILNKLNNRMS